jgi:hypothetical protein
VHSCRLSYRLGKYLRVVENHDLCSTCLFCGVRTPKPAPAPLERLISEMSRIIGPIAQEVDPDRHQAALQAALGRDPQNKTSRGQQETRSKGGLAADSLIRH